MTGKISLNERSNWMEGTTIKPNIKCNCKNRKQNTNVNDRK